MIPKDRWSFKYHHGQRVYTKEKTGPSLCLVQQFPRGDRLLLGRHLELSDECIVHHLHFFRTRQIRESLHIMAHALSKVTD
jgi:hypothetical protein